MSIQKIVTLEHVPAQRWWVEGGHWSQGAVAGLDLGKMRHPSHCAILLPYEHKLYQIASWWADDEPYTKQLEELGRLFGELKVKYCLWDATRGELSVLQEQGQLPEAMMWGPVTLTLEAKAKLAGGLCLALERGELVLLPDERQRRSILSVNNALQAAESESGHGDAFWSLALAVEAARRVGALGGLKAFVIPLGGGNRNEQSVRA